MTLRRFAMRAAVSVTILGRLDDAAPEALAIRKLDPKCLGNSIRSRRQ
jgi:hypothetical protein